MKLKDIQAAVGGHLLAMTDCPPVVWSNKAADPARPYLSVQHVPVSRRAATLTGDATEIVGFFVVTVVSEIDRYSTEADNLADALIARFPAALRIPGTGGRVLIRNAPEPLPAFRDGDDWRQPVRIPYGVEP